MELLKGGRQAPPRNLALKALVCECGCNTFRQIPVGERRNPRTEDGQIVRIVPDREIGGARDDCIARSRPVGLHDRAVWRVGGEPLDDRAPSSRQLVGR